LAVGPGGACVLCLRAERGHAQRRARRFTVGFFASMVCACGGLLAVRLLRTASVAEPRHSAAIVPAITSAPEAPSSVESAPAERAPSAVAEAPVALENVQNVPQKELIAAASAISPVRVPAPSAEPASSVRVPSKRELQAALQATPVSMLSASWCPHCQRARRFFRANGLSIVDRDIDTDARAAAELVQRTGRKAVPLIDVDGRVLQGFDEQATIEAVAASIARRLGVANVQLSVASASN